MSAKTVTFTLTPETISLLTKLVDRSMSKTNKSELLRDLIEKEAALQGVKA